MKNHLGERMYQSYNGWRTACRRKNPSVKFEGNIHICNAPGVGEWDGEYGVIYSFAAEKHDDHVVQAVVAGAIPAFHIVDYSDEGNRRGPISDNGYAPHEI